MSRLANLQTLRASNGDAAFSTAFVTLTTGAFLVGFVKLLGGNDLWIGLLSAIPSLLGVLQIPGAVWGRSFPSYKRFVLPGGAAWRLLFLPLVVLPLLPLAPGIKLVVLATCVAVASACVVVVNPIFNEWIAELVPPDSRGFFFSRRNALATAVGAATGLVGAFLLDAYRARGQANYGFAFVFGLGLLCAAGSFAFFLRMQDLPRANPVRQSLGEGIRALARPFADPAFRRVLVFLTMFVAGQSFSGNLFSAYGIETLKLDFKIIQGAVVAHAIGNVLCARLWGFLSDKYGNKPVLVLVGFAMALNPLPWVACAPGDNLRNASILIVSHVIMGAVWSGVALCQFNLMLATAREEDRATYLGAGMAVTAIVGGVAPLLGAGLMSGLRTTLDPEHAYKMVFLATVALRFAAVFFVIPVRERGSTDVRTALRHIRGVTPRGMRAMRELARGDSVETREEAIRNVAQERVEIASDEIVKALHDPLPRVRREAAAALGRLHDPRAVAELVHQIEEHPDLVEEETVEALGELGRPEAVPALVRTLQSPRSLLRRAAAKSLGRIGSHDSVEALTAAAAQKEDPDLRRAALQALRAIGATQAGDVIAEALSAPHPSVRVAAAEAVAELELHDACEAVRASLEQYGDEASAEVAYALGAVGSKDDIPLILQVASHSASIITRRRCLLGVARLLGVEREAYRLMRLEGMGRDTALFDLLGPAMRRDARLRAAVSRFTGGDEPGALQALARVWKRPAMQTMAENPVEELFLVAAPAGLREAR